MHPDIRSSNEVGLLTWCNKLLDKTIVLSVVIQVIIFPPMCKVTLLPPTAALLLMAIMDTQSSLSGYRQWNVFLTNTYRSLYVDMLNGPWTIFLVTQWNSIGSLPGSTNIILSASPSCIFQQYDHFLHIDMENTSDGRKTAEDAREIFRIQKSNYIKGFLI